MRILHDAEGVDFKERLQEAFPDHTILSSAVPQVLSSRNVTSLTSQIENSYPATDTHGTPATPDQGHRPQRQYKAKTQYRLVYAQVGYALRDAPSIDKAFKAINDVLTGDNISLLNTACADQDLPSPCSVVSGWVGAQGYQYRQYHCCGG